MILKTDYNALILVGLWNKGVFNPDWVSKFLLPENKKLIVEYPLNIDASPRVSSDKIRIFMLVNKLSFIPLNTYDETFETIQDLALKTADYLPHTPVTAFGINFHFETTDADDTPGELLHLNDAEALQQFGATIKSSQHQHTLDFDRKILNLAISNKDDSKITFAFNFHFDISDLTQFKEQIHSNPILDLKELSLNILQEVYGLKLKNKVKKNGE